MKCLHLIVLLLFCTCVLCHHKGPEGSAATYQELVDLNSNCSSLIRCIDKQDNHLYPTCDCGPSCVQRGTCCVDSENRFIPAPDVRATCRLIKGSANAGFFMVDQCPQQTDGSVSKYEELCREEWNGQNDIMRLVPVTSLFSHVVYKNYFCFRCHESGNNYVFWDVKVQHNAETDVRKACGYVELEYDEFEWTWYAPVGPGGSSVPVEVNFTSPKSVERLTKPCNPSLISDCPDNWEDDYVRAKCDAYLYLTYIRRNNMIMKYRNPHCALCNYELLYNIYCPDTVTEGFGGGDPKKPFSFTMLIDINRADGDKVGQRQVCSVDEVYDPYFKKCRTPECAVPGYIVRGEKCVPP